MKDKKYITVLDSEKNKVFQYQIIDWYLDNEVGCEQFLDEKVIYNLKGNKKTLTFDLAVALTACCKWYSDESNKIYKKKKDLKNPNSRRRMEYNDRIERYLRGDLSSIQKKS